MLNAKQLVISSTKLSKKNELNGLLVRYLVSKKDNLNNIAPTSIINELTDKQSDISKLDTRFENSEIAFKSKTNIDLIRGLLVFQICSLNFLINNQNQIMNLSRKILGKRLFALMMKSTFYGHFVAGESQALIKPTIENMMKYGVKSILDYSVEDDLETVHNDKAQNTSDGKYFHPLEYKYDKNMEIFMECIDAVSTVTNASGLAAIKVTSLLRPQLLVRLNDLIVELKKTDNDKLVEIFKWKNFINGQTNLKEILNSKGQTFTDSEVGEIKNLLLRLDKLISYATKSGVRVFVDAEQTYFQSAIRFLTIQLMREFNRTRNVVFNTYQNYLKSAHNELLEDLKQSEKENFYFGAKLVRGAYMEQERPRAVEHGYEDPINPSFEETTKMYEKSLLLCMSEIKKRERGHVAIMVASHNENTVKFAVQKMDEYDIKASDRVICFGQLYGMCDYLSFSLGAAGYSVYKYTPYGPVEEVLPYLSRRAIENRGIFDKVKKEKRLLFTELKRRIFNGQVYKTV